jgi:hypothetical protein
MPIRKTIAIDDAMSGRTPEANDAFTDALRSMKNTKSTFAAKAERRLASIDPDSCKIV